jgi:hypothetical protein
MAHNTKNGSRGNRVYSSQHERHFERKNLFLFYVSTVDVIISFSVTMKASAGKLSDLKKEKKKLLMSDKKNHIFTKRE